MGATTRVTVFCPGSMYVGSTSSCSAQGYASNGTPTSTFVTWWSSSNSSVVNVNGGGGVYAGSPGTAWISATIDGVTGSAAITVNYVPVLTSVSVTPSNPTVNKGYGTQLTATARDQYGAAMSGYTFTWSSGNTAVATVGSTGFVSAIDLGSASISATTGGVSGSTTVTVVNGPLQVSVSGPQYTTRYQSAQFTATTLGGTPGYTYQWRTRQGNAGGWGSWSGWYSSGSTNYTYASISSCGLDRNDIQVQVTDAVGGTATSDFVTYLSNPC